MNERDKKVIIKIDKVRPEQIEFRCVFEDSEYHLDDMPVYNFDLINFGEITDVNKILKEIGKAAYMIAGRQEAAEKLKAAPVNKLNLKSLVGQEFSMSVGEIYE